MIDNDELSTRLVKELNRNIERKNTEARMRLFGVFLEIITVGYAWYHFGWQMVIVIFLLLWAINIKVRIGND